jgi:cell division protein FtsB
MTAGESLDDEYDELKARRVHHDRNIKQLESKTLEVSWCEAFGGTLVDIGLGGARPALKGDLSLLCWALFCLCWVLFSTSHASTLLLPQENNELAKLNEEMEKYVTDIKALEDYLEEMRVQAARVDEIVVRISVL